MLGADDWAYRIEAAPLDGGEQGGTTRTESLRRSLPTRLASCPVGTWRLTVQRWGDDGWVTVAEAQAAVRAGEATPVTLTVP